jgi:hypothetical protein
VGSNPTPGAITVRMPTLVIESLHSFYGIVSMILNLNEIESVIHSKTQVKASKKTPEDMAAGSS